ncbi:MAG: ACP S-malonyltransferase [Deltaproteobacteria bacterium]|nr:ACP S-malonyltransferase [Deltaproteobacteria bacterium]
MERRRIAFIFPGQGSQYPGMGVDISNHYPVANSIFTRADDLLGYKISTLCWEKDEKHSHEKLRSWLKHIGDFFHLAFLDRLQEKLHKRPLLEYTRYSQPAVFTASVACLEALRQEIRARGHHLDFDMAAGHSLGEYTAFYAAGALDFEDALLLVKTRGEYMQDCGEEIEKAGLLSILGKTKIQGIDRVCQKANVHVAVYNTDYQIVLGGYEENLKHAKQIVEEMGFKGVPLKVSGPFHTYLMKPAADRMHTYLAGVDFTISARPVIANTSTRAIVDPMDIKNELTDQIFKPVLWKDCVEKMIKSGVGCFVEIGPGKVLNGLIGKVDPHVQVLNVEDQQTLESTVLELIHLSSGAKA